MIMIADWIERIEAECPALLDVEGAAGLAVARTDVQRTPCAYVLPTEEKAEENHDLDGGLRQRVDMTVSVYVVARNHRDAGGGATGEATGQDITPLIDAVIAALVSWKGYEIEYQAGKLTELTDSVIWWELKFSTYRILTGDEES